MAAEDGDQQPDITNDGIALSELEDGTVLAATYHGEDVAIVRDGGDVFVIGAVCTHYGGPLAQGVYDGAALRCPWHHACFDVRTGVAVRAPALDAVTRYTTEIRDDRVFITGTQEQTPRERVPERSPTSVAIIGSGAAGLAAADIFVREGYSGELTILSRDQDAPYDRPSLSKDFLAGSVGPEDVQLRDSDYYKEHGIELRRGADVVSIDAQAKSLQLADGTKLDWEALLLAPGSEPVHLDVGAPTADNIYYLRTWSDSKRIVNAAKNARHIAVVGASFIGMEVAASLRERDLNVTVIAPEPVPFEPVVGEEIGWLFQQEHEAQGVQFMLGKTLKAVHAGHITLDDDSTMEADMVIIGVGVKPRLQLAESAGLRTNDGGVLVDEHLATSQPGIWAAGDIAVWPDAYLGQPIRTEHWIVAERQGQVAARNMLGHNETYSSPPLFWTTQFDLSLGYVGHAEEWDDIVIDGSLSDQDFLAGFRKDGRINAVAAMNRDQQWLEAELAMESGDPEAVAALFKQGAAGR